MITYIFQRLKWFIIKTINIKLILLIERHMQLKCQDGSNSVDCIIGYCASDPFIFLRRCFSLSFRFTLWLSDRCSSAIIDIYNIIVYSFKSNERKYKSSFCKWDSIDMFEETVWLNDIINAKSCRYPSIQNGLAGIWG